MRGRWLGLGVSAVLAAGCITEDDVPPDAGLDGSAGGGVGGAIIGGGGAGQGGGGPVAFPSSNPDCAADAVVLEAHVTASGPFTRSQPAPISYQVFAEGQVHIFGRSQDGGNFDAPSEGHLRWWAGGGKDDPLGANVPIWQGNYHIELAAQDADGCVGLASLEIPMVGDVLVGDSNGQLSVRGSDGRWVVATGTVAEQGVSALIRAPDAPGQLIAGLRTGIGGTAFVARIDVNGAILSRFAEQDLRGEPLFESGGPRHLYYDAATQEILCDGVPDGAVLRFNLLGDYLGRYEVGLDPGTDYVAIGFSRQEGQVLVGTSADDRIYALAEAGATLYVDAGGSSSDLYAVAPGADDTVLAVHADDRYEHRITAFGPGGQELRTGELGELEPEHVIPFRGGYLTLGVLDPMRRLGPDLDVLEPTADGDKWDDWGGFGYGSTTSMVWLNAEAPQ